MGGADDTDGRCTPGILVCMRFRGRRLVQDWEQITNIRFSAFNIMMILNFRFPFVDFGAKKRAPKVVECMLPYHLSSTLLLFLYGSRMRAAKEIKKVRYSERATSLP